MEQAVHQLTSRGGLPVRVRRLTADDAHYLVRLYDALSPRSRLSRFHNETASHLDVEEQAAGICAIQPPHGLGIIAFIDLPGKQDTPAAAARYRLSPPDEAEVSITVRDDMQNQGIGTQLLGILYDYAREHGIRTLFGLVPADSGFLRALTRRPELPLRIIPRGEYTYVALRVAHSDEWTQK